jgi:hypothetical protein
MFLRKLFKSDSKLKWVFIDLIIVIIGVYTAFLIQSSAQGNANRREQEKVFSALKYELESFRIMMPKFQTFMQNEKQKLDSFHVADTYSNFAGWRYIQPQYSYQIVEYAINLQGNEIIDFQLYQMLQDLYVEIKRLEYTETRLEEISRRYQTIPATATKGSAEYELIFSVNMDNFKWFRMFAADRAAILGRVAEASANALPMINERLDEEVRRKIERDIIEKNMGWMNSFEDVVKQMKPLFPDFTETELSEIWNALGK